MANIPSLEGLTILETNDINPDLILRIERSAFPDEQVKTSKITEPPETRSGIEYLLLHGRVIYVAEIDGVAESIKIEDLLSSSIGALPKLPSPLRMIVDNDIQNAVLSSIKDDYPGRDNYHYSHGVMVLRKGQGYGNALFKKRLEMVVKENELMFGFIMASPANIAAVRMALRNGAVIDKIHYNAYELRTYHFRWVYDKRIKLDGRFIEEGVIMAGDYLERIVYLLARGYVGKRFEPPNLLFFKNRS